MPEVARIVIALGSGTLPKAASLAPGNSAQERPVETGPADISPALAALDARAAKLRSFHDRLVAAGLGAGYEAAHTQLALETVCALHQRRSSLAAGKLPRLSQPTSEDPRRQKIFDLYMACGQK